MGIRDGVLVADKFDLSERVAVAVGEGQSVIEVQSDSTDPLKFLVTSNGYEFISGKGSVKTPDGKVRKFESPPKSETQEPFVHGKDPHVKAEAQQRRQPSEPSRDKQGQTSSTNWDEVMSGRAGVDIAEARRAAEAGNPAAQLLVGLLYANGGDGVQRDYQEAEKWLTLSAEQGNQKAVANLIALYDANGALVKGETKALGWLRVAAEGGLAAAQYKLGAEYARGRVLRQDFSEAARWYEKSALQGMQLAQYNLAVLHYKGADGVERNFISAAKWYRAAAEQGHTVSQVDLAFLYLDGKGVQTDPNEAVRWFRKAAERGDPQGQYNLGICYFQGSGVSRDVEEAKRWFGKAAAQGHKEAQHNLGVLARQ